VEPIFRTPNVFVVLANSAQPGLLILNERWSDAWHARINSQPAKVLRANFTQPAVALPAGRNYVEFEYKPTLFWNLLILQRVTILLLVVVGVWKLLRAWPVSVMANGNLSRVQFRLRIESYVAALRRFIFRHLRTTITYASVRCHHLSTEKLLPSLATVCMRPRVVSSKLPTVIWKVVTF
jgi:hypothetical protein